jgi:ABC-2 type transport system permease protein
MNRLLFIARFEYVRHFWRYLLMTVAGPIAMVLLSGVMFVVMAAAMIDTSTLGYVDHAGMIRSDLARTDAEDGSMLVQLAPYASEAAAQAALAQGDVAAYVVLPPDYLDTGVLTVYGPQQLTLAARERLRFVLRESLTARLEPAFAQRAADPVAHLTQRTIEPATADTAAPQQGGLLLPAVFGMVFFYTILAVSGYLLQAMVEERENRTLEMIVTSVSPRQLFGGKILGLGLLGLTPVLLWALLGGAALGLCGVLGGEGACTMPTNFWLIAGVFFLPGYLLYAAIMVLIGAMVASLEHGQQLTSFVTLVTMVPLLLASTVTSDPHGPLAVGMSFFPFTASLTLVLRAAVTTIPFWQIGLSLGLLLLSGLLLLRGGAHIFGAGIARYGRPVRVYEVPALLFRPPR